MIGAFFVTLREGFEAALIIGIVLTYLRSIDAADRARQMWLGVAAAIGIALVVGGAIFLTGNELEGTSEQLYEGTAMLLAAAVLTWMIFWMRRQAATLGAELRSKVSDAVTIGGLAIFWLAFVTVLREGIETALFMYAATDKASAASTLIGGTLGLAAATGLGVMVYRGGRRLDMRRFFQLTSLVLLVFAGYLVFGAVHELGEVSGSEAVEEGGFVIAPLYIIAMLCLYLRPPSWLAAPAPAKARAETAS